MTNGSSRSGSPDDVRVLFVEDDPMVAEMYI
jgi:hypothetical protein